MMGNRDGTQNWTFRRETEHLLELYDAASSGDKPALRARLLWVIEGQEWDAHEWEKLCGRACEQLGTHSTLLKKWRARAALATGIAMGAVLVDAARALGWLK